MVGKRVRSLIEEVAREEHIPVKVAEKVIRDSLKFVADTMRKGDRENWKFKSVDMPGLGVFNIKPSWTAKMKMLTENKQAKLKGEK